jgi:hypothetical protein
VMLDQVGNLTTEIPNAAEPPRGGVAVQSGSLPPLRARPLSRSQLRPGL